MLTRKQHELLMFIHERMKESGIPPSFDEMKDALDLRSKSGIHRLITALEERGFIRRLPNRARALEVIKLPDSMNPSLGGRKARFEPNVIEGNLGRVAAPSPRTATSSNDAGRPVAIPVMGRIAAGTPIEAIQNHSHTINVPPEMLGTGEHFALAAFTFTKPTCSRTNVLRLFILMTSGITRERSVRWLPSGRAKAHASSTPLTA